MQDKVEEWIHLDDIEFEKSIATSSLIQIVVKFDFAKSVTSVIDIVEFEEKL